MAIGEVESKIQRVTFIDGENILNFTFLSLNESAILINRPKSITIKIGLSILIATLIQRCLLVKFGHESR